MDFGTVKTEDIIKIIKENPKLLSLINDNKFEDAAKKIRTLNGEDGIYPNSVILFFNVLRESHIDFLPYVTHILHGMYNNDKSLTSIVIPSNVKYIDAAAFSGCIHLKDVNMGSGVTSLGSFCFSNCHNLKSLIIPNSVKHVSSSFVSKCWDLKSVSWESKKLDVLDMEMEVMDNLKNTGRGMFYGSKVESVICLDGVLVTKPSEFDHDDLSLSSE